MILGLAVVPFVVSFVLSLAVTYITIEVYKGLDLVDHSTKKDHPKHIHGRPVPRGGGVPIYVSLVFASVMFSTLTPQLAGVFLGGFILLVLGVLDDVMDLSPYLRLGLGFVVAGIVVFSGIGIEFVSNPFQEGVIHLDQISWTFELWGKVRSIDLVGDVLAIFWIVWGMNFVNMGAKGLDGQLPGVVVIAASVLGILGFRFVSDPAAWNSIFLSFALAGAYGGFLVFNFYPQKIMPGWGGGSLAGYFLAVLAILSGAKLATALIVLGVPLMDVLYAIARRISHGRSPVWGDDKHLHHFLLKVGWGKRRVAVFYWLVSLGLGLIALNLKAQGKIYTLILIGAAIGGLLLWIKYFILLNRQE